MTDLVRDLAVELDLEVSSSFAARVRAKVERQPQPSRGWIWGLAGVAAAASVAVGVVMMRPVVMPDVPGRASLPSQVAGPSNVLGPYKESRSRTHVTRAAGAPTEQALALNRLLLGLRAGQAHVSGGTPAPVDQDGLLLVPEPLQIPQIHIAPIEIAPLPAIEPLGPSEGQK